LRSVFTLAVVAALALALASCGTVPKGAPAAVIAAPAPLEPTRVEEPAAAPEEPITAAEIAVEPMHPDVPPEPPGELATGGDPDSVATPLLRSEYGDLWVRIRVGFILDDLDTPSVKKSEDWYAARPDYIARMVERSRRYLYHIVVEVEKRGMPLEIALLPMIESAYNPMAYSRSRASGIWQFMPSTGKSFGMEQNWWRDERRDVIAATDGALDYLQKLHAEFGDWYLALAAYNWGEGSVRRAIAANRKRGQPVDYLSLKMPAETRDYIPKLQAVKNIVSDPERYDLTLAGMPDAPYFTVVQTKKKMDVKVAAELAEIPLDEFLSLNPQHNRPVIAGADQTAILLPYDKAEVFAAKLELTDQPMVTWQAYKFRAGETLQQVAVRFGLPLETLRTVNGIGPRAKVPVGHTLLVPSQRPSRESAETLTNAVFTTVPQGRTFYYRVNRGDTLPGIAGRYAVTAQDLRRWNNLSQNSLTAGQQLRITSDLAPNAAKAKRGSGAPAKVRSVNGAAKVGVRPVAARTKPAAKPPAKAAAKATAKAPAKTAAAQGR
jgi:membrane-bound lytic murein transglycosylase D